MVFIVLAIGLLFSLAGLAVDMIFTYAVKVRLVTAVDSTALGIARALGRGVTQSDQATEVLRTSDMLFNANFPQQFMLTGTSAHISQGPTIAGPNVTPMGTVFENDTSVAVGTRQVRLTGEVMVPMFFFRIFGVDHLPVRAAAKAARQDVDIMLVLDRSASMANAGAWAPLQNAAVFFLSQFDNTTDNLGIVTYGSSANVDLPIGTGFKTGNVGQNRIMNQVVPSSAGTNAPMGLWLGLAELLEHNNPNALNVIAFFTDGNPTGYTAQFSVFTTASGGRPYCPGFPSLTGALLTGGNTEADVSNMYGIFEEYAPYPAVISGTDVDYYLRHQSSGYTNRLCTNLTPWLGDQVESMFSGTCLPANWTPDYKNPAGGGQRTYSTTTTTDGPSFSINRCDAALFSTTSSNSTKGRHVHRTAKTISLNIASDARTKTNALGGVIIYSIGLGSVDPTFLTRISNDPVSVDHVGGGSQTDGLYVFAPTPAQLQQAFQQVANEIFRLIQ
jgi:von Willebrand factor type A domain